MEKREETVWITDTIMKMSKANWPPHQKHPSKEKAKGPGVQISVVGW